jgi:hypothetical protein
MSFTASREDFKLYLTCPRKLAFKTLGVKVREGKHTVRLPLSYSIGVSGEKLTEEVLEIIASLQIDRFRGEYVEVYEEKGEDVKKAIEVMVEALSASKETRIEDETLRGGVEPIVESTIREAFTRIGEPSSFDLESYKEEMKRGFLNVLKGMLDKIPKILAVYKQPVLRNRDTCSLGYPDYQVETEKDHILVEVKNAADLDIAIREAKNDLLYYNSLLADRELGDSVWRSRLLPSPAKSLIVIPRQGVVKEALEPIPNFREIAVEIWKIKRAALVDGVLPDVRQVSSVCRRCGYKRLCEKMKVEQIEPAKPLPLIYAIAEYEIEDVEESKPPAYLNLPSGFWKVYLELKRRVGEGDEKAKDKLNRMDEYLNWLHLKRQEDVCKVLYRVMPDEFDSWGGLNFLKENYVKVANTARILYPHNEDNVKVILKVARKRWES